MLLERSLDDMSHCLWLCVSLLHNTALSAAPSEQSNVTATAVWKGLEISTMTHANNSLTSLS